MKIFGIGARKRRFYKSLDTPNIRWHMLRHFRRKIHSSTSCLLKLVLHQFVFIFPVENYTGFCLGFKLDFQVQVMRYYDLAWLASKAQFDCKTKEKDKRLSLPYVQALSFYSISCSIVQMQISPYLRLLIFYRKFSSRENLGLISSCFNSSPPPFSTQNNCYGNFILMVVCCPKNGIFLKALEVFFVKMIWPF